MWFVLVHGQLHCWNFSSSLVAQNQTSKYPHSETGHDGKPRNNLVPKYEGIIPGIRAIYKEEGLSGLFKGIHLTTLTSALANALFFYMYMHFNWATRGENCITRRTTPRFSHQLLLQGLRQASQQQFWLNPFGL